MNISSYSPQSFKGDLSESQLKHLLSRTLFGATVGDLNKYKGKTIENVVDSLLEQNPVTTPPVNYYQSQLEDPFGIPEGSPWVGAPYGNGDVNFRRRQSFRYWWIQQMWFQKSTLEEKMILFWHNHFATQLEIYDNANGAYYYQSTLRKFCFGNFKAFTKAITIEPAMLEYLNGQRNTKEAADENYARELQELFTLGKGPDSKYEELDVREAAKVLTGHRYRWDQQLYGFSSGDHNTEDKTFSAFYGNKVIKGREGNEGKAELDELLDMIFAKEEVSKFIVRKLYIYFIHYNINEQVESSFITPMAKVFRDNNYEIKPLMKAFLSSEHFLDNSFHGAMIASPLDLIIKTLRHFEPPLPPLSKSVYLNYSMTGVLMRKAETAQQHIGDPPSVSGWSAYYQKPLYNQIWINSDSYQKRSQFIAELFYNEIKREEETLKVDYIAFLKKMSNPSDPSQLIIDVANSLLSVKLSTPLLNKLKKDILLSGQESDFYWTEIWDKHIANPSNVQTKDMVNTRAQFLLFYISSLPEYQLI